jgi:hypothetical protein
MTRNREIDLRDLTECDHTPEVAVTGQDGTITHWLCRCGKPIYPGAAKQIQEAEEESCPPTKRDPQCE